MMIVPNGEAFDEETTAAVESALSELIGSHGGMLESFVGMANYINRHGERCFVMFSPSEQLHSTTSGLARFMDEWNTEITRLNIHGMSTQLDPAAAGQIPDGVPGVGMSEPAAVLDASACGLVRV